MHDAAYEVEAIARARRKLEELRSGKVVPQPAGVFWGRRIGGGILVLIGIALPAGFYALFSGRGGDPDPALVAAAFFGVLGLAFAVPGLLMVMTSRADTPRHALALFYKSIGRGNMRGARKLVVPNDLDDFPRHYPDQRALGHGGTPPYEFDTQKGFHDYWTGLVRYPSSPYCIVQVRGLHVEQLDADLAVAEFDLHLSINTSLWILLALLTLLLAFIVDLATRKRVQASMRKILVRVGDEWHFFSGEWQGPDEEDDIWLEDVGVRKPR
ncbi:MAG: hypothetical protein ACHQ1G_00775 [Planctomycetota bacterium]